MGINKFTPQEVTNLELNPYVQRVSQSSITYTQAFKELFILKDNQGMMPTEIFREAGFDPAILKAKRIDSSAQRWRKKVINGQSLEDERPGNSGCPKTKNLTVEEEFKRMKAQIAYLKAENDFLKKLEQAEREAIWKANLKHKKNTK